MTGLVRHPQFDHAVIVIAPNYQIARGFIRVDLDSHERDPNVIVIAQSEDEMKLRGRLLQKDAEVHVVDSAVPFPFDEQRVLEVINSHRTTS